MSKTIRILVGLSLGALTLTVVSVLIASALFVQRGAEAANESSTIASGEGATGKEVTSTELTAAEVASHNNQTNCWMIVSNNVYNFTTFLNAHPGGAITMTPYCGKEATNAFNTKDKKPATKHTSAAIAMLSPYYVGALGSRISTIANGVPKANVTPLPKQSAMSSLISTIGNTASALLGTNSTATTTTSTTLSSATVASHNTSSNCWIIVSGAAYDVTGYLVQHPGGVGTITPYCGRDATNAFVTKDKGSAHSSFAYQLLGGYKIGTIGSTVTSTAVSGNGGAAAASTMTPTPTLRPGQSPTPTATPLPVAQSGYTTAQVSTHTTSSNCWIIVSSKAYNVSSYLVEHPGGVDVITPYCGKEATNAFATKGYGSNHSNSAYTLLNNYFVGNIVTGGAAATPTPTSTPVPGAATPTPTPVPPTPTPLPQNTGGYTTADVASHNTSTNCWIIISNKVYTMASYLTKHPGGVNVITKYCGKESTNAFATKDGKNKNHSTSAYNQLAPYFIGNIVTATQPTPTPMPGQPTATPVPGVPTATPVPATSTPTPTQSGANTNCTKGMLPSGVSSKYPGATIKSQSIDNCSQELEIITTSGQCRHLKTNSSGSIREDDSC